MTKWEYLIKIPQHDEDQEQVLDQLGALGWELTAVMCYGPDWVITWYFKREVKK